MREACHADVVGHVDDDHTGRDGGAKWTSRPHGGGSRSLGGGVKWTDRPPDRPGGRAAGPGPWR